MKKYLSLFLVPFTAVSLMSSALAPVSAQAQTSTASCYTFTRNLGEGRPINIQEATALAQDLSSAGVWSAGTSITIYNDSVASAVSGFQEKYASQVLTPNGLSYGTGFVGASTRTQLNNLYGCSSTSQNTGYSNTGNGQTFQCPSGYTCAPKNQALVAFTCPSGYTCSPTNPVTTPAPTPTSLTTTCPTGYTCTYSPSSPQNGNCPAGYVCSIPPVTTSCPSGYTCSTATLGVPTPPSLISLSVSSGAPGSWISVYGSGFSSPSTVIVFNGNGFSQQVSPNSLSSTAISLYVPSDLSLGTYSISAANLGNGWTSSSANSLSFTITSVQQTTCPAGYTCNTNTSPVTPPAVVCPTGYTCSSAPGSPQNGNCPAGYTCSSTNPVTTCPTGYTCTSNPGAPQIGNCPAGYTCYISVPTIICPSGYTCTSTPGTPQNGNCPADYICSVPVTTCPVGFTCSTASSTNP